MSRKSHPSRGATLQAIRNPLVFFALALLVIEAIFGVVISVSKLTAGLMFAAICIMALLFLVVVGVVAWITIYWPEHLYEKVERDLRSAREVSEFLKSPAFREVVQGMVDDAAKRSAPPAATGVHPLPEDTDA